MNMNTLKKVIASFTFILFCTSSFAFTLVLDAGHGGQDAGAIGSFSKEKNINLTYVLALGEKIAANHKDVKIIYTRTTDVFIPLNEQEKYAAIIEDIKDRVAEQRPVLVGTISIENSELLSNVLTKSGIEHKVLNAKFHAQEAQIVAQAGRPGAVTIATNMAGRGR